MNMRPLPLMEWQWAACWGETEEEAAAGRCLAGETSSRAGDRRRPRAVLDRPTSSWRRPW